MTFLGREYQKSYIIDLFSNRPKRNSSTDILYATSKTYYDKFLIPFTSIFTGWIPEYLEIARYISIWN